VQEDFHHGMHTGQFRLAHVMPCMALMIALFPFFPQSRGIAEHLIQAHRGSRRAPSAASIRGAAKAA